jgi:hypothetical protein
MTTAKRSTRDPFAMLLLELLASDAFRSLTLSATRALFRTVVEHYLHYQRCNGNLIVTHRDLVEYGLADTGTVTAAAMRMLADVGLVKITRNGSWQMREPSRLRLTFYDSPTGPATHEWRQFSAGMPTVGQNASSARARSALRRQHGDAAKVAAPLTRRKTPRQGVEENGTDHLAETRRKTPRSRGGKLRPGKSALGRRKTPRHSRGGKLRPLPSIKGGTGGGGANGTTRDTPSELNGTTRCARSKPSPRPQAAVLKTKRTRKEIRP